MICKETLFLKGNMMYCAKINWKILSRTVSVKTQAVFTEQLHTRHNSPIAGLFWSTLLYWKYQQQFFVRENKGPSSQVCYSIDVLNGQYISTIFIDTATAYITKFMASCIYLLALFSKFMYKNNPVHEVDYC